MNYEQPRWTNSVKNICYHQKIVVKYAEQIVVTDGTYKLNYEGFPILLIGTVDLNREYHPFGILITKTEDHDDYQYMFQRLKDVSQTTIKPDEKQGIKTAN